MGVWGGGWWRVRVRGGMEGEEGRRYVPSEGGTRYAADVFNYELHSDGYRLHLHIIRRLLTLYKVKLL